MKKVFLLFFSFLVAGVGMPHTGEADEGAATEWFRQSGAVVIAVPDSISLPRTRKLTLGSVAQFEAPEKGKEIVRELKNIRLGAFPQPGRPLMISQESIAEKVRSVAGNRIGYYINMPSKTLQVSVFSRTVSAQEVQERAEEFLRQQYARENIAVEVISLLFNKNIIVPAEGDIQFHFRYSGKPVAGRVMLQLEVRGIDNFHDTETFPASFRLHKDVLVAQRDIPAGEIITEADVAFEERDITSMRKVPLLRAEHVVGLASLRQIPAGTVILKRNLKTIPAIKRGANVLIVAEGASFRLTAPGIAQQNGGMHETIRVLNPGSKKVLYGTVIGKDVVRISF